MATIRKRGKTHNVRTCSRLAHILFSPIHKAAILNPDPFRDWTAMTSNADPFDLARFVTAQADCYQQALMEIRNGEKESHWMWFIFPQIAGLGSSVMAKRYAITSLDEATAYLHHPLLGPRLQSCCEAVLGLVDLTPMDVFGTPDDMKLQSSMTLFSRVAGANSCFGRVLEKWYAGQPCARTLALLGE